MTKQEADFIGSMNMCDEISNEAYKKIMCHCEVEEQQPCEDCISRAEVLDIIIFEDEWLFDANSHNADTKIAFSTIKSKISEMPSVTPKAEWIPVSERLPDTDDEVLCWYEYYHWSREKVLPEYGIGGYLRETSAWFGEVANGKDVRVIAWMPLPPSYQGE